MFTVSLAFGCHRISILMDCFNWESNIDEGNLNLRKKIDTNEFNFFFYRRQYIYNYNYIFRLLCILTFVVLYFRNTRRERERERGRMEIYCTVEKSEGWLHGLNDYS